MTRIVLAAWLALTAGAVIAQGGYPEQTVRILVGFSPGVAPDITARILAEKLASSLAKAVVVDNVTGAGGTIATEGVARAGPYVYTLALIGNGSLIFSPAMY